MKFLVWAAETLKQITISTGPRETNTSSCCSGNTQLPCYCSLGKGWNISLKWVSKKKTATAMLKMSQRKEFRRDFFICNFHITSLLYESLSSARICANVREANHQIGCFPNILGNSWGLTIYLLNICVVPPQVVL